MKYFAGFVCLIIAAAYAESAAHFEVRAEKEKPTPDSVSKFFEDIAEYGRKFLEAAKDKVHQGIDGVLGTLPGMAEKLFTEYGSSVKKTAEGWITMIREVSSKAGMPEKGEQVEKALNEMAQCVQSRMTEITPIVKEIMIEYKKKNSYKKEDESQGKPAAPESH